MPSTDVTAPWLHEKATHMSTKLWSVESRRRYHGTTLPGCGEPSRLTVTPCGESGMLPRRVAFSDSRIEARLLTTP